MQNNKFSFSDTKAAFQHKNDFELKMSKFIFSIFKFSFLVNYGPGLTTFALKIKLPIKGVIKKTVFNQFCGGETIDECDQTVSKLWQSKVGSILDYSVEGHETEENFDANLEEIKHTIQKAKGKPQYSFCVFKPTGIARFALLEMLDAGKKLSHEELNEYYRVKKRFEEICKTASENDVKLFIDAEESWIQDTIDALVTEMMAKFNEKKVVVFNTVQLYRKDRLEFVKKSISQAREKGYLIGFKLVRGAYMEKEAERALQLGYPNPIQDSKQNSDNDYDESLRYCFENRDIVSVCAGTHNESSSMLLVKLMEDAGLPNNDPHFWFAQLYGMSDNISFVLASQGYNVTKYLPYGPIKSVMPYLGRRAKENSSMSGQMGRELALIIQEIERRKLEKHSA
jgi:proline dehydrogenase